ncbi:CD59A glycoprotein-like isoform X2 [Narcine bancroftii]
MENSLVCLLLSLCFVLGSSLKCYVCEREEDSLCEQKSCIDGQNACLNVTFSKTQNIIRRCWSDSNCDVKALEKAFNIDTGLKFTCCSWDLCNSKSSVGPGPTIHPFFLGLLSAFATLYVCWFKS